MACDVWLDYPDFNEDFKTHTNDSNLQLGAVIVTFYSKKLTGAHMSNRILPMLPSA